MSGVENLLQAAASTANDEACVHNVYGAELWLRMKIPGARKIGRFTLSDDPVSKQASEYQMPSIFDTVA